jgi:acyl-coenzyme A thioesterase PaaI-like protein
MIDEKYKGIAELSLSLVEAIKRTGLEIVSLKDRYAKFKMPLQGNTNHIGIMYAGSLFTLGEFTGGIVPAVSFDIEKYYPIVKEINIRFLAMAKTDVYLESQMSEAKVAEIQAETDENGKADFDLQLELKDEEGEVVSTVNGTWQLRKILEEMKGMFTNP